MSLIERYRFFVFRRSARLALRFIRRAFNHIPSGVEPSAWRVLDDAQSLVRASRGYVNSSIGN